MRIDVSSPCDVISIIINEETQTAEAKLFNLSSQTIIGLKYEITLYSEDGEIISKTEAELEGINFPSGSDYTVVFAAENAIQAEILFCEVTFEDGNIFIPQGNIAEIPPTNLSESEILLFEKAGVCDAKCYAKDDENYWLCVCGRPNMKQFDTCIRCGRTKEDVMSNFTSEQNVAAAGLIMEEQRAREEAERAAEEARIKAEQKALLIKKIKKTALFTGSGIVILALLITVFSLVTMLIGNSNAEKGNYEKAEAMYSLSLFNKTEKIAERYYGNTTSNLIQGGILAQDDKNIYYLNAYYGICIENKETGEKIKTEFSGSCLNASGGSLYFLNMEDNFKIYRMDPETLTAEAVCDMEAFFFMTAGNDIFFISQKPVTNEIQSETMGQMALYVLKAGEKDPTFVSDAPMSIFTVYKDKIYYVDYEDGYSLYKMNLSGKGAKKIIDTPVYNFDIKNDTIYFTDGTIPEGDETGIPKLSLETAKLNGKGRKTLLADAVVKSFALGNDAIYYSDNNQQSELLKYIPGQEPSVEAPEVYLANAHGDFVYYLNAEGKMYLTKLDKSGYEVVSSLEDIPAEEGTAPEAEAESEAAPEADSETEVEITE